jgi:hypothetical protein
MEIKNGKQRSSEIRQGSQRGKFESESRSMGTFQSVSTEHGSYPVATAREDRDKANTSRRKPINGISGKIVSQLIEETEKQLAYHEQQAEVLRERLKELKQVSENNTIGTE